jgi:RNA polymerase sigma-70 factor, ECF subfamily
MTISAAPGHQRNVTALNLVQSDARSEPASRTEIPSDELIATHSARVWRSLRYLGVPDQDLPDACQETFLVMHRRRHEFRGESSYGTWVYGICLGIARNAVRSHRRRQARYSAEHVEPHYEPSIEAELDVEHTRSQLRDALARLSEEQREVFVLHEIEELPMSQVARTLGCPLFTAYSRHRLAQRKLKKLLEQLGGTP